MAVCVAIAVALGLPTFALLYSYDVRPGSQLSDEELAANFLSHEAAFDQLAQILATNHAQAAAKAEAGILRQIAVEDVRYFPDSGKLVLVPDGEKNPQRPSKSYVHLPLPQSQSPARHHGFAWREPGVGSLTGDRPLQGSWFIHHDMTMQAAVTPY